MQASAGSPASAAVTSMSHNTRHHHRNKKDSDPFLGLADADIKLSDQPSPSQVDLNGGSHFDSLLVDLVLTPLNMVSFVLSLFVIDRQQRQWRLSQHPTGTESIWFRLTHWSWFGPEPYQDSRDSTWKHSDNSAAQNGSGNASNGWYTRKKHRAVAKMEIKDAFEMRRRVVLALLAWALVGFICIYYAAKRMYGWMYRT